MMSIKRTIERRLRLLVCDDDAVVEGARTIELPPFSGRDLRVLTELFDLAVVSSADAARDILFHAGPGPRDDFDVVLLDVYFRSGPGPQQAPLGFLLAQDLLDERPDLPVVIWSGAHDEAVAALPTSLARSEMLSLGFVDKTLTPELHLPTFVRVVFETAARWREMAHEPLLQDLLARLHRARSSWKSDRLLRLLETSGGRVSARLRNLARAMDAVHGEVEDVPLTDLDTEFHLFLLARLLEAFRRAATQTRRPRWKDVVQHLYGEDVPEEVAVRRVRHLVHQIEAKLAKWEESQP